jgi:hypothetical protein
VRKVRASRCCSAFTKRRRARWKACASRQIEGYSNLLRRQGAKVKRERVTELSVEQLDTLRHMLGINDPSKRKPEPYRNHYCANPGDEHLWGLSQLGMVEFMGMRDNYEWFQCTEEGRLAAIRSHRSIQYSKSKRVYIKFLDIRDCCPDLTFKQFLTDPRFKESRADA